MSAKVNGVEIQPFAFTVTLDKLNDVITNALPDGYHQGSQTERKSSGYNKFEFKNLEVKLEDGSSVIFNTIAGDYMEMSYSEPTYVLSRNVNITHNNSTDLYSLGSLKFDTVFSYEEKNSTVSVSNVVPTNIKKNGIDITKTRQR